MPEHAQKHVINSYFARHELKIREQLLALLGEMVAQRTVNVISERLKDFPFLKTRGEEYRVAAIVKKELQRLGVPFDAYEPAPGRSNVIARCGQNANGERLLVAAHMDVVPPGDGWSSDPWRMEVRDGKVYGRGVLDNKGPLVSCLLALEALVATGAAHSLPGEFQVACLADEEAGDGPDCGIGYLLKEQLIHPTMAVIPDIGGNMMEIDIAEKGGMVLKVTARGVQAHGSTPERGDNAVTRMACWLANFSVDALTFNQDPVLGKPTVNVGQIRGGAAPNIVPSQCEALLDIRLVRSMTQESVLADVRRSMGKEAARFDLQVLAAGRPHSIAADNPLVQAIQANSETYFGRSPVAMGMGGGTFAKTLNLAGIPAVGFGPGDDRAFHMADEYVEITQLVDFARLLCLIGLDLLA